MALPIEQISRRQRFVKEHPEWYIQARNWGRHYLAEKNEGHGWHVVAALTLRGLTRHRLDEIEDGQ